MDDLLLVFKKWGKVTKIFIVPKRNKTIKKYRFCQACKNGGREGVGDKAC